MACWKFHLDDCPIHLETSIYNGCSHSNLHFSSRFSHFSGGFFKAFDGFPERGFHVSTSIWPGNRESTADCDSKWPSCVCGMLAQRVFGALYLWLSSYVSSNRCMVSWPTRHTIGYVINMYMNMLFFFEYIYISLSIWLDNITYVDTCVCVSVCICVYIYNILSLKPYGMEEPRPKR